MSDEVQFVNGLIIKAPVKKDGSPLPDWIKATGSIKVAELVGWLNEQEGEWVNFDVKESKKGKWYVAVDNWTPTKDEEYAKGTAQAREVMNAQGDVAIAPDFDDGDIPF